MKCCDNKKAIDELYKNIALNDSLRETEDSKEIEETFDYIDNIKNRVYENLKLQRKDIQTLRNIITKKETFNFKNMRKIDTKKIGYLPVEDWQCALRGHMAFTQDPVNQIAPMAFQFGALYFYRAWQDEYRIAQYIKNTLKKHRTFVQSAVIFYSKFSVNYA